MQPRALHDTSYFSFDGFERLAEAPSGWKRLRGLLLFYSNPLKSGRNCALLVAYNKEVVLCF